jgi:uncharacterized protein
MLRTFTDDKLLHPDDMLVQASPISGRGLFAARPCRADETLLIIDGEPVDETEALRRERAEANWYIYWNDGRSYIDAARTPMGRYLNHACQPNTIAVPRDEASLYLVALRDIAAGEELTMDYDYPEIYDICRSHNPGCLHAACPRAAARIQGDHP